MPSGGKREGAGRPKGSSAGPRVSIRLDLPKSVSDEWDRKRGEMSRPESLAALMKNKRDKRAKPVSGAGAWTQIKP
jgi:hypothetical protein